MINSFVYTTIHDTYISIIDDFVDAVANTIDIIHMSMCI